MALIIGNQAGIIPLMYEIVGGIISKLLHQIESGAMVAV